MLGLLGCLALAGLIAAIVVAANAHPSLGTKENTNASDGIASEPVVEEDGESGNQDTTDGTFIYDDENGVIKNDPNLSGYTVSVQTTVINKTKDNTETSTEQSK